MKKLFSFVLSAMVIMLASCTQDDLSNLPLGQEMNTKVSMQLPTMQRAGHADPNVNGMRVLLIVSHEDEVVDVQTATATSNTVNFDVRLVTGQSYDLAAWADFGDAYYTVNATEGVTAPSVSMVMTDATIAGSDNKRDAYFAISNGVVLRNNEPISMTLKRPFGLVKIVTNDYNEEAVKNADLYPDSYTTTIEMPTTLSLVDGTASNNQAVTIAAPTADVENSGELSFDYIFASTNKELIDFTMDYKKGTAELLSYDFKDIPLQRNYKTNISGNILTKQGTVTVTIEQIWDTPDYTVDLVAADDLQAVLDKIDDAPTTDPRHVTINLTGDLPQQQYNLPALNESSSITINMQNVAGDREVAFVGGDDFKGTINLTNTATKPEEAVQLTITVPQGDATIGKGYWNILSATTRPSTLRIEGGANVETINVKDGNVNIYEGANVGTVSAEKETTVYVEEGATTPEVSGENVTIVGNVDFSNIKNVTTGKDYATIRAAVIVANEGDVIEIAEGAYDLGEPGQTDDKGPNGYYLKLDKSGLTLRGKGNVEIFTSDNANTGMWSLQNLVTVRAANVTLENITFIANYNGYYDGPNKTIEVYSNEGNGFVIRNCKLVDGGDKKDAGCLYIGADAGDITNATVENCTFVNSAVNVRAASEATIKGCTFDGVRERAGWDCAVASRGEATVENCQFVNCTTEAGKQPVVANGNGLVNLVNNTFPTEDGVYYRMVDNGLVLFNGSYSFSGGEGTYENPYLLSTPEDVLMIGRLYTVNKYESIYSAAFKMTQDIDISATPIRNLGVMGFLFDGDGHTLTVNLTSESTVGVGSNVGLLAAFNGKGNSYIYENASDPNAYELNGKKYTIKGGCIRDLVIAGTVKSSIDGAVASLVGGYCTGYIINVTNNATIEASNGASFVAGIVSYVKGTGLIFDCTNNGNITVTGGDNARPVGGITAQSYGGSKCDGTYPDIFAPYSASVNNCTNNGDIDTDTYDVGGIMGQTHGYGNTKCITNCTNRGAIKGTKNVGGILGRHCSTGGNLLLSGNTNSGTLTATTASGSIYGVNEGTLLEGSQAQN